MNHIKLSLGMLLFLFLNCSSASEQSIENLDAQAYKNTETQHKNYQADWVRIGYAPEHYYLKDFSIVEVNGVYHLFHIAGTPGASCVLAGNEIWFCEPRT